MAFTKSYFIIDNIKSSDIGVDGVEIVRIGESEIQTPFIGARDVLEDDIPYRDISFFYGTKKRPIEFSVKFSILDKAYTDNVLFEIGRILGQNKYIEFKSSDKLQVSYYVIPTSEINLITYGTYKGWYEVNFRNIASYAYSNRQIIIKDLTDLTVPYTFDINCKSNVQHPKYGNIYIPEKVEIQLIGTSTSFTLTNLSDMGRVTQFTELSAGETITMYPNTLRLESSTGLNRLSNFNKNWFRLTLGKNILKINEKCIIAITTMYPLYM